MELFRRSTRGIPGGADNVFCTSRLPPDHPTIRPRKSAKKTTAMVRRVNGSATNPEDKVLMTEPKAVELPVFGQVLRSMPVNLGQNKCNSPTKHGTLFQSGHSGGSPFGLRWFPICPRPNANTTSVQTLLFVARCCTQVELTVILVRRATICLELCGLTFRQAINVSRVCLFPPLAANVLMEICNEVAIFRDRDRHRRLQWNLATALKAKR